MMPFSPTFERSWNEAPLARSSLTTHSCALLHAHSRGVSSEMDFSEMDEPVASIQLTRSWLPMNEAQCSGVKPARLRSVSCAPWSRSQAHVEREPLMAAQSSGVWPNWSRSAGSHPLW